MNPNRNQKRRKFDYVANLLEYSLNLNRDTHIQIDYTFVKPKDFKFIMDEKFPDFQYTNNLCSLIDYSVYEIDELNKKITRFVNGLELMEAFIIFDIILLLIIVNSCLH
jgi:hypothetical protein